MKFEWDEAKNRRNQRKHGISFETAARAFADQRALTFDILAVLKDGDSY